MNPSAKIFRANSMVIPTKKTYSPIWNGGKVWKRGEYGIRHNWRVKSPLAQECSSNDGVAFRETLRCTIGWLLPRRPNPGRLWSREFYWRINHNKHELYFPRKQQRVKFQDTSRSCFWNGWWWNFFKPVVSEILGRYSTSHVVLKHKSVVSANIKGLVLIF